ncbi:MAG: DUF167 domain-containing protein [Actinomycetes bacterium]
MRVAVHVQPGSRLPKVGGLRAGSLSVRVREAAVDGNANEAVLVAVAKAFEVRPRNVRIVHGRSSRRKLLEIEINEDAGAARLAMLRTQI